MKLAINLASRRQLNQRLLNLTYNFSTLLLIFVLLVQGKALFDDYTLAKTYQLHLDAMQQELLGKQPEKVDQKEIAEQLQSYNRAKNLLQRDAFRWTALFDRMEILLPEGVSLRSFRPDYGKNSLAINGVARSLNNLQIFLDKLQKDNFQQVYLKKQGEVSADDGRGGKITALSFSISLTGVF